jgi:hypothetical protein
LNKWDKDFFVCFYPDVAIPELVFERAIVCYALPCRDRPSGTLIGDILGDI